VLMASLGVGAMLVLLAAAVIYFRSGNQLI
jgi:hypothetical protein